MTDRELMEMAAKAAGLDFSWNAQPLVRCNEPEFPRKTHNIWNPLDDDGDALRLAVKLGVIIDARYGDKEGSHLVCVNYWPPGYTDHHKTVSETSADQLTATRRAIVRAAAEIGRGLRPFPTAEEIRESWT